jgi:hypothetical protein
MTLWVQRLLPYSGPSLWRALEQACEEERLPTLKRIKDLCRMRIESTGKPIPVLAEAEQVRSDHAATMSMLWLHHEKGWSLSDFGGHILSRQFAEQLKRSGQKPHDVLAEYAKTYDREKVAAWMQTQQRIGS